MFVVRDTERLFSCGSHEKIGGLGGGNGWRERDVISQKPTWEMERKGGGETSENRVEGKGGKTGKKRKSWRRK
jgi:hypothetical protein